jgi:hypothetical protein
MAATGTHISHESPLKDYHASVLCPILPFCLEQGSLALSVSQR